MRCSTCKMGKMLLEKQHLLLTKRHKITTVNYCCKIKLKQLIIPLLSITEALASSLSQSSQCRKPLVLYVRYCSYSFSVGYLCTHCPVQLSNMEDNLWSFFLEVNH